MGDGFHRNNQDAVRSSPRPHLKALGDWYDDASGVIDNFDAGLSIIRYMLTGSAAANLRIAESLSALLVDSELWLLTHPCPDRWNGEFLSDVVGVFFEIGQDLVRAGGDTANTRRDVEMETEAAAELLANVKDLARQVAAANRS